MQKLRDKDRKFRNKESLKKRKWNTEKGKNQEMLRLEVHQANSKGATWSEGGKPKTWEISGVSEILHTMGWYSIWLRNLEFLLNDDDILEEDWAFILQQFLSSEPLKITEAVQDDKLNDY